MPTRSPDKTIVDKVLSVVVSQDLGDVGEGRVRVSTANGNIRVLLRYYKTGEMHIVAESGKMTIGSNRTLPVVVVTTPVVPSKA
jgi:hypothetical protein